MDITLFHLQKAIMSEILTICIVVLAQITHHTVRLFLFNGRADRSYVTDMHVKPLSRGARHVDNDVHSESVPMGTNLTQILFL